jgi:hypothetical protein
MNYSQKNVLAAAVWVALAAITLVHPNSAIAQARRQQPFAHINKYGGEPPTGVLEDKALRPALKKLLGKHFAQLERNLTTSEGATINSAGALEADGCERSVCTIEEAKIYIEKNGRMFVAILTEGTRILYFTNDKNEYMKGKMIDPIQRFADRFPSATVSYMQQ